ncbi:OPSB protein, partial [Polypterus senegalus]|nr:OPSB protein [Polypterus senegalus]
MSMAAFMFFLVITGLPINLLTVVCTFKYKKLRSHLNYILVNLAVANLLVVSVGSTTAFYSFFRMFFSLGATACKIEGFVATVGVLIIEKKAEILQIFTILKLCSIPNRFPSYSYIFIPLAFSSTPVTLGYHPNLSIRGSFGGFPCHLTAAFCWGQAIPLNISLPKWMQMRMCLATKCPDQSASAPPNSPLVNILQVKKQRALNELIKEQKIECARDMCMGFLVCWLPYASFSLWVVFHRGEKIDLRVASVPSIFSKAFRSCMMKLIFCGKSPFGDEDDTSSQVTQVSSVSTSQVAPA